MENPIIEASFAQLVGGSSVLIPVDFFHIRQLTLREVAEAGRSYDEALGALLFDKSRLPGAKEGLTQFTDFNVFCLMLLQNEEFVEAVQKGLDMFIVEKAEIKSGLIVFGEQMMNGSHWDSMQKILKQTNGLSEKKEDEFNPANEEARKMHEKFKSGHEKVLALKNKQKKKTKREDSIYGMALTFSAKSPNTNLHETLNMTIPQFIYSFKQLVHASTVDDNFDMLLNGADSKKIKLSHWTELFKEE